MYWMGLPEGGEMEKTPNAPRSLTLSTRLYQALLTIYPSEFRRDYGAPMLQVFRGCAQRALSESGAAGLLSLWIRTMLDTVQTALEEHTQRGVDMSKEKFYKLSGWAMIVGPILFLIGGWANNRPPYVSYAMSSLPIDRYAIPAATPLIVVGLVFMSLGILGVLMRYSPKLDGTGFLLGIGALAGLVSAVGAAILSVNDSSPWWELFILGMAIQYIALAIFGFVNLRRRLLPRWNGLPILALWFPAATLLSLGITPWEITLQVFAALWILTCVMFAGLGYLLQADSAPKGMAAAA
jgi:hypothetical protein